MKFSHLTPNSAQIWIAIYQTALNINQQNNIAFTQMLVRFLVLGQSAGLATIVTLIANEILVPIKYVAAGIFFVIGLAAMIIVLILFMIEAAQRQTHMGNQIEYVLRDELDVEKVSGWQFHKPVKIFLVLMFLVSIFCFVFGVWGLFDLFLKESKIR